MKNNSFFKIDKDSGKGLIIFFLIMLVPILYVILTDTEATKKQLLSIDRHTKVIRIYKNEKEHNFLYVDFSNKNSKILEYPYLVGDSLSKNKGDSIEYIFRDGKILENNFLEAYRKKKK